MTSDPQILDSLARPASALVVGASGGLGAAFVTLIRAAGFDVRAAARHAAGDQLPIDLTYEASVTVACRAAPDAPPLRLVIVATGLLHDGAMRPEKNLRALDPAHLARSFAVNAIGPALVAKHALPRLPREGKSVFAVLSARVGSISDNRLGGWYGYRASKAALNQIVRTLAIEMKRSHPDAIVVALHPGTVATVLSAPFRGQVAADQLFTPADSARRLLRVLDTLDAKDSGTFRAWDGREIPW